MASKNRVNTENPGENVDSVGISQGNSDSEEQLKREKVRTKSYFTRSKNKLLFLVDKHKLPSYDEIENACDRLDGAMESVLDVMSSLSELYWRNKETENSKRVIAEMEKIEDEFTMAYGKARLCMDKQQEQTSETSEILTIDMFNRMNIVEHSNVYAQQQNASQMISMDCHSGTPTQETPKQVGHVDYPVPQRTNEIAYTNTETQPKVLIEETEQKHVYDQMADTINRDSSVSSANMSSKHSLNSATNQKKK